MPSDSEKPRIDVLPRTEIAQNVLVPTTVVTFRKSSFQKWHLASTEHRTVYSTVFVIFPIRQAVRTVFHLLFHSATLNVYLKSLVASPTAEGQQKLSILMKVKAKIETWSLGFFYRNWKNSAQLKLFRSNSSVLRLIEGLDSARSPHSTKRWGLCPLAVTVFVASTKWSDALGLRNEVKIGFRRTLPR